MSVIDNENNNRPKTVPCGTPDKTGAHPDFEPLTTTLCCLEDKNECIHRTSFALYVISKQFALEKFMGRGIESTFSKSNINVSTCPSLSKISA